MNDPSNVAPVIWSRKLNQIPKEVMVRKDLYELERARIFLGPEWHPIAHEGEIPQPADFKTMVFVEVPLLVTRDMAGKVHVLHNSCSHRGTQIETAFRGNRSSFECPYHRWVFSCDGQLNSCPKRGEGYTPDFNMADFPLREVRAAIYKGLIFITFSEDTPSLEDYLQDLVRGRSPGTDWLSKGSVSVQLEGIQRQRWVSCAAATRCFPYFELAGRQGNADGIFPKGSYWRHI
jgi:phenylpropionate dioxygenase-like ring-hydroxylating dioxygenase large terminal subunit